MRQAALALILVTFACNDGADSPAPGSRAMYEPCESNLPLDEELCAPGLVCQGSLDPTAAYCAPACPAASEDIWSQDSECPEIEGFVSYCGEFSGAFSCVIRCESSCPDGLGLQCPDSGSRCEGQGGS
mgnify:CR=1 FL=1